MSSRRRARLFSPRSARAEARESRRRTAEKVRGTFACYQGIGVEFHNRVTTPRSACTVKLTKIGNLGDRIEGSFSVTVDGNTPLEVSNATFSVERVAFP